MTIVGITNNRASHKPEGPSNARGPAQDDHGGIVSGFEGGLGGIGGGDLVETVLTLPSLKAWGFLIHRLTFKHYVLSAILKLFNRTKVPIDEPNSQQPQRVYLQKRTRILT
jgi:hypothetical protein